MASRTGWSTPGWHAAPTPRLGGRNGWTSTLTSWSALCNVLQDPLNSYTCPPMIDTLSRSRAPGGRLELVVAGERATYRCRMRPLLVAGPDDGDVPVEWSSAAATAALCSQRDVTNLASGAGSLVHHPATSISLQREIPGRRTHLPIRDAGKRRVQRNWNRHRARSAGCSMFAKLVPEWDSGVMSSFVHRVAPIAMAFAAVAMTAACSVTTPGSPVADGTQAAGGDSSTITTGTGVATTPTVPAPVSEPLEYVDVSGEGNIQRDVRPPSAQFGDPAPGITIGRRSDTESNDIGMCTLGPAVVSATNGPGFVTAGHCADEQENTLQYAQVRAGGGTSLLGPTESFENAWDPAGWSDSAVIWTQEAAGDSMMAGSWPVEGVMGVAEVRGLPAGTPICINAAVSGVVCSPLISADADLIRYGHSTTDGDSGAPVFVVRDGRASLIGIHRGADEAEDGSSIGEGTYLAPALDRLGVRAVTAP